MCNENNIKVHWLSHNTNILKQEENSRENQKTTKTEERKNNVKNSLIFKLKHERSQKISHGAQANSRRIK